MKFFRSPSTVLYVSGLIITLFFGSFLTFSIWQDNPYDEFVNPYTREIHYNAVIIMIFAPAIFWTIVFTVLYGIIRLVKIVVRRIKT